MTMYAWECSSCHHEWQSTISIGDICEWCGEEGVYIGEDVSQMPSNLFKELTGGMKDI